MSKDKCVLFLILLFLSIYMGCTTKVPSEIVISGAVKNLPKGLITLNLEEDINLKKSKPIAEIPVDENGRFKFEGDLVPHIYSLKINDKKTVMLAVNKGQQIVISGDTTDAIPLNVTGSEDTAKFESYEKFRKESLNRLVISVRNEIKNLTEAGMSADDPKMLELAKLEIINYDKHKDEMIEFVKKEMGTSIAVYATSIRWDGEKNIAFLNDLAKKFEQTHPNSEIAERLKEKVRIQTNNRINGKVTDIIMPDKYGKTVSLTSIKAKYTLIDFWGSWCAPCRRESAKLAELYKKYNVQGFEIYSVGLESEKELWLKAIEQDKRTWTNVSTFQEFQTPATFDYAVTSLPANFLIDGEGKVITKNLHGKELEEMLEKLFSN